MVDLISLDDRLENMKPSMSTGVSSNLMSLIGIVVGDSSFLNWVWVGQEI